MKVLALDLGTQTGWAYAESGTLESGTENFTPKRGDSKGVRFLLFNRFLKDMGSEASLISYERAHMRGGAATEILHGFSTRVDEFCAVNKIESMAVHSATLKKHATGSGRANKTDMLEAALKNWPEQFDGAVHQLFDQEQLTDGHPAYDQADALFLMDYTLLVV